MHLEALQQLDTHVPVEKAFRKAAFWAEVLACLPHCPPFVTFEIVLYNWSNIVMYRAETFFCVINSVRVYLLWPVVRDKVLLSLPRRHTIAYVWQHSLHPSVSRSRGLIRNRQRSC